jgi:protein-disulfide isomerase
VKRRFRLVFSLLSAVLILTCVGVGFGQEQISKEFKADVVATINDNRVIRSGEIDEIIASQIYGLQERIYSLRKIALDNLITKIVLEHEARIRGITVEQLNRSLMPENVEVKQSHVDEVYLDNKAGLGNMPEDEAKQRIKLDLENRERLERYKTVLADIKSRSKIVVMLPEPIPPIVKISEGGPSKGGSRDAAVTIVAFSDFQCPYCKQAADTIKQVMQGYGENVRLVFKHLPLPIHTDAFKAAQASVCAAEQGKFWEYHDRLFSSGSLSGEALRSLAEVVGLRIKEFSTCLDSASSRAVVTADMKEAKLAEIQSTPTFIINGRVLKGARSQEDFKKMINEEIEKRQQKQSAKSK